MKVRLLLVLAILLLSACTSHAPMKTVDYVDIPKFMGKWYVIANIPTFIEKGAHNAIEQYTLDDDGSIATTFTYYDGDFDGELKTMRPRGFIKDTQTNALWGMQFIWPIKADYRIVYLDKDYQNTVIARKQRDYVWIMSRKPIMEDKTYEKLKTFIQTLGYDLEKLEKVPQYWPDK